MAKLSFLLYLSVLGIATAFVFRAGITFNVDQHVSVELPNQPTVVSIDTIEADGFEHHLKIYSTSDEYGYYRISRNDLNHESDNYLTSQGRKEWHSLGPMMEGALFQAKFLKRKNFSIKDIEGVDRSYELPATQKNERTLKYVRSLLIKKVGYELWFIPRNGFKDPCIDQKTRFFNSINLNI